MEEVSSQNLTDEELQKSYWLLTHKDTIRQTAVMVLTGVCLIIWTYAIFLSVYIIFIPWQDYQKMTTDIKKQYSLFPVRPLVVDIQKNAVSFVQSEDGVYDLYVHLKNSNPLWYVYFDAVFSIDGVPLRSQPAFLLPDEEKYLMYGGLKRTTSPGTLDVELKNLSWKRISKKEKDEIPQKMNFTVQDIKIDPVFQGEGGGIAYTKLTFKILNGSVYRFWDASVPIIVKAGDQIIAVNILPLTNFGSGELRPMESRWYADLSMATAVDIIPSADIFDPGVYQSPTVKELIERSPDIIKQEEILQQQLQNQQQLQEEQQY